MEVEFHLGSLVALFPFLTKPHLHIISFKQDTPILYPGVSLA